MFPEVPYQLCQFHYLREAGRLIDEKDRHAKKELKKRVRNIRGIERKTEGRTDPDAEAIRGDCSAVRSALTDDGRPPLEASGLKLHERLSAIGNSLDAVEEKRGSRPNSSSCEGRSTKGCKRRPTCGPRFVWHSGGSTWPPTVSVWKKPPGRSSARSWAGCWGPCGGIGHRRAIGKGRWITS